MCITYCLNHTVKIFLKNIVSFLLLCDIHNIHRILFLPWCFAFSEEGKAVSDTGGALTATKWSALRQNSCSFHSKSSGFPHPWESLKKLAPFSRAWKSLNLAIIKKKSLKNPWICYCTTSGSVSSIAKMWQ